MYSCGGGGLCVYVRERERVERERKSGKKTNFPVKWLNDQLTFLFVAHSFCGAQSYILLLFGNDFSYRKRKTNLYITFLVVCWCIVLVISLSLLLARSLSCIVLMPFRYVFRFYLFFIFHFSLSDQMHRGFTHISDLFRCNRHLPFPISNLFIKYFGR